MQFEKKTFILGALNFCAASPRLATQLDKDDKVVQRLTCFDAAHATDALTLAPAIVRLTVQVGPDPTFPRTRPAGLGRVLASWTYRMIEVRSATIACS